MMKNKLLILGAVAMVVIVGKKAGNEFWRADPRGNKYDAAFAAAEARYTLPSGLLRRMAYQESRFNPDAVSTAGAVGILQFMPGTAAEYGINPRDPMQSIDAAGRYMAKLYRMAGSWRAAVAAYNWGIGNVQRKGLENAPAETVAYMKIADDVGVA